MDTTVNSPDYRSQEYQKMHEDLVKVHDAWGGTKKIRAAGTTYLPKWPKEKQLAYQRRLVKSLFFNVFKMTVQSLVGLAFLKPPTLGTDVPPVMVEWLENCDLNNTKWTVFAKELLEDAVRDGHAFLYVDMPPPLPQGATLADERAAGRRPYWVKYQKSQYCNHQFETMDGRTWLTQITFRECATEPDGMFGQKEVERYRVLRPGSWQLFKKEKEVFILEDEGETSLKTIPISVVYGQKDGELLSTPPLLDLVDLNIDHYQLRSDLRHVMHVACVPIPYAVGRSDAQTPLEVGPNVLVDLEPGGSIGFAEITGASIDRVQNELASTVAQMATLGMSVLANPDTRTAITATEKILDFAQESSQLATIMQSHKDCLETGLQYMAEYAELPEGGSVNLNQDLMNFTLDANTISTYSGLVREGQLTVETLWQILKAGGKLPDGFDPVKEAEGLAIQSEKSASNLLKAFDRGM